MERRLVIKMLNQAHYAHHPAKPFSGCLFLKGSLKPCKKWWIGRRGAGACPCSW
ncbi:hypothetical protein [Kingella oralis]|uniref:hypothetical protein n=1 Tax=Kingella oralis TaxID=505 RepID=UPI0034E609DB